MTAGVLTYQLCDREFDCDACQLDTAMRMLFSKGRNAALSEESQEPLPALVGDAANQLLFSRNHCWVQKVTKTEARVGIEPSFASLLLSPKAIVLPSVKDDIMQSQYCFWIVTDGGTIPMKSPIAGEVSETNSRVAQVPSDVSLYPEHEGWLFEMKIRQVDFQAAHLMDKEEAETLFSTDMKRFRELVTNALTASSKTVGLTLADGGQALSDASEMLGVKRYYELIREVFG